MPLAAFIDRIADYLNGAVTPAPALIAARYPAAAAELPAAALSVRDAEPAAVGLGSAAERERRGALETEIRLDLADPVIVFPDEAVSLLSPDRRELRIPHGPLVRADGSAAPPFTAADFEAALDGAPLPLVANTPQPGQVQLEPETGTARFGSPLPATGELRLRYFVGRWEVLVRRVRGTLEVELFAAGAAALDALSRSVADALRSDVARPRLPGLLEIQPRAWAAAQPPDPDRANALSRLTAYAFDFELLDTVLPTGGGVIRTVQVDAVSDAVTERFEIP